MGSSNASSLQSWKCSTLFQISICYDYSCSIFTPHPLVPLFLKAGCTSFWRLRTGYRLFRTIFSVFCLCIPLSPSAQWRGLLRVAAKPEQTHHTAPDSISPGQHLRTNFLLTDLHPSLRFSFHPSCIAFLLPCYLLIRSFISSSLFSFLSLLPLFSALIHFPLYGFVFLLLPFSFGPYLFSSPAF